MENETRKEGECGIYKGPTDTGRRCQAGEWGENENTEQMSSGKKQGKKGEEGEREIKEGERL